MENENMPSIKDIVEYIGTAPYFITGSYRFGNPSSISDIDICVFMEHRNNIYNSIKEEKAHSDYNNGFKFIKNGTEYNIIPLHQLDYVAWYKAAQMMMILPLKDKKERPELHGYHEMLVGINKAALSKEYINNQNYLSFCEGADQ